MHCGHTIYRLRRRYVCSQQSRRQIRQFFTITVAVVNVDGIA